MKRVTAGLWATLIGAALLAGCERPPMESSQRGYRGTGMAQITNPRIAAATQAAQPLPADVPAVPSDPSAPLAKDAFKNVQVLGNQQVGEFTRTMLAITAWVSPEQGCNYCHEPGEDLSSDKLYTKVVARKMLAMNQSINGKWKAHVGETGVTCYTCHRGQPVPARVWYDQPGGRTTGFTADSGGQNLASKQAAYSAMGVNVLADYLVRDGALRQSGATALPAGNPATIRQTEGTFGLMMHISQSLGVNCTYCHATQAHPAWDQSPMARTTAYQGIRMARDLNNAYVLPLAGTLPAERLGPLGDVPKVNCGTCHQGVSKPLNGAPLAKGFPALAGAAK